MFFLNWALGILSILNHIFGINAIFLDIFYFKLNFSLILYISIIHFGIKFLSIIVLLIIKFSKSSLNCISILHNSRNYKGGNKEDNLEANTRPSNQISENTENREDNKMTFREKILYYMTAFNMFYSYRLFPIMMTIIIIIFEFGNN